MKYLKKAPKTAASDESNVRDIVKNMLDEIKRGGEESAHEYAQELDGWQGEIVVSQADLDAAEAQLSEQEKHDIQFAQRRIQRFAQAQRDSMHDLEYKDENGVTLGHRHVPVNTAGCYVPGGRYAHIASALMSITTAKVWCQATYLLETVLFPPLPSSPIGLLGRWGPQCCRLFTR